MTMRSSWRTIGVLITIIAAALVACNAGNKIETLSGPVAIEQSIDYDPCALVTKAEAEAILGEAVDAPKNGTTPALGHKTCDYVATAPTPMKMVTVFLHPLSMGAQNDMWNGTKEMWRKAGEQIQPVTGLGQDAFVDPNGTLQVLTPKCILVITVKGLKGETQKTDAEKAFAQKALSRM
jgi:hypothetical protein